MHLQIAKWGNSLALRIPADHARRAGIKEGDTVDATLTPDGGLSIRPHQVGPQSLCQGNRGKSRGDADGRPGDGRGQARRALLMALCYVDTSVLVALCTREPASNSVSQWYAGESDDLVSSVWCVTEFASALGIKRRTKQFDQAGAEAVWRQFERLCANDLRLLPLEPATFHRAALLTLDASNWPARRRFPSPGRCDRRQRDAHGHSG